MPKRFFKFTSHFTRSGQYNENNIGKNCKYFFEKRDFCSSQALQNVQLLNNIVCIILTKNKKYSPVQIHSYFMCKYCQLWTLSSLKSESSEWSLKIWIHMKKVQSSSNLIFFPWNAVIWDTCCWRFLLASHEGWRGCCKCSFLFSCFIPAALASWCFLNSGSIFGKAVHKVQYKTLNAIIWWTFIKPWKITC